MLKLRNIGITFIVVLIAIAAICFGLEQRLIANAAVEASTYVQIAAKCALTSATMSDEFFVSGTASNSNYVSGLTNSGMWGGSTLSFATTQQGLRIDRTGSNKFTQGASTNVFALALGSSQSPKSVQSRTYDLFKRQFTSDRFKVWASNILNLDYSPGSASIAKSHLVPWFGYRVSGTNSVSVMGKIGIPKLLTMGASLFVNGEKPFGSSYVTSDGAYSSAAKLYTALRKNTDNSGKFNTSYFSGATNGEIAKKVLEDAGYWYPRHTSSITLTTDDALDGTGTTVDYYVTPLSIGLTYVDQDVLDVLFRVNMDLLMRSKYLQSDGTLDDTYHTVIDNAYYSNTTAYSSNWGKYVVNNGKYYYLRGKPSGGLTTLSGTTKLEYNDLTGSECSKPDIDYMYLCITADNCSQIDANKELSTIIHRAISPTTSATSLLGQSSLTAPDGTDVAYELVIAKVTFYADFMYPYSTSTLRGMQMHWGSDAEQNYLGMQVTPTVMSDYINENDWADVAVKESSMTGGVQYAYTCYFAVAD